MYIIVSEGKEKQKTVWVDNYDCSRAAYNVRLAQQQLCFRWDYFFALIVQAVTMTSVWIAFKDYSWKSSEIWSIPFYIPIPPVHLPAQDVPDPP